MPLFGSKHNHDHDTIEPGTGAAGQYPHTVGNQGTNAYDNTTYEQGTGHQQDRYPHTGVPGSTRNQGTNTYDNTTYEHGTGHQQVHYPRTDERVPGNNNDTGTQGTNAYNSGRTHQPYHGAGGPVSSSGNPLGNPTYSAHHGNNKIPGETTVTKVTGKVESAVGSMVGSNTLKAKGLEKERKANIANLQGLELAEAERLEREAMMRRQRVGQGAHPANTNAGAGQVGWNGPTHPGGYSQ